MDIEGKHSLLHVLTNLLEDRAQEGEEGMSDSFCYTSLDVSDVDYSAMYPPIDCKEKKKERADKIFANHCKGL